MPSQRKLGHNHIYEITILLKNKKLIYKTDEIFAFKNNEYNE